MNAARTSLLITLLVVLSLSGCATNPVTGKSDFVLMSEDQEISLGRQFSQEVLKSEKIYDNPSLQAYVQRVGEEVARRSHRPDLVYRFHVIDSTDVNAFALPGGYIYISRGLLAYLNSEAELAAVLGHEVGHVTARHSVRQHSTATATGLIGAVIASQVGVQGAGDVANLVGGAIVRGYGREHELEADRLGAEYLAHSGYNPQAMLNVVTVLKNQELFDRQLAKEEGREPRAYHGLFSTHPSNDTRLQEVIGAARRFQKPGADRVNREAFLQQVDGMTFGDSEDQGVLRGNNFYHTKLDFGMEFPAGWKVDNRPDKLVARAPANDGLIMVQMQDINKRITPRQFMEQRLKLENLRNGESIRHGGKEGYTAIADMDGPWGRSPTRLVVLYYNSSAYIFLGTAKDNPYQYEREILAAVRSFHALTEKERRSARAQRIELIRAGRSTRYSELARTSPVSHHAEEQLRLINGQYPQGEPVSGQTIKVVR